MKGLARGFAEILRAKLKFGKGLRYQSFCSEVQESSNSYFEGACPTCGQGYHGPAFTVAVYDHDMREQRYIVTVTKLDLPKLVGEEWLPSKEQ